MMGIPENPRLRMYYPIEFPLDKDGRGPVHITEAVKISYQVWDQVCVVHGEHDHLLDAIEQAERLNKEHHK